MSVSEPFYGDKYSELEKARPVIEEHGLFVPPTIPVSQQALDQQLAASGLPSIEEADNSSFQAEEISEALIFDSSFIEMLASHQEKMARVFGGPVILRSSARGDAIGTGTYRSKVLKYKPGSNYFTGAIMGAASSVISSYFSEEAKSFRNRAKLAPGFGMFMQPLVGTVMDGRNPDEFLPDSPLFRAVLSGNVKSGTILYPDGIARLQQGFGAAVDIPDAPKFDLGLENLDSSEILYMLMGKSHEMDQTKYSGGINPILFNAPYIDWGDYWSIERNLPMLFRAEDEKDTVFTLPQLRDLFSSLTKQLGGATYFEFTTRQNGENEELYVTQVGELIGGTSSDKIPHPTRQQILLDGLRVESCAGTSLTAGNIVCMGSPDEGDLAEFDRSEQGKEGYILVMSGDKYNDGKMFNFRKLKNVSAIIVLTNLNLSTASDAPIEEHFIGYTEASGVPILNIKARNHNPEWRLLNGTTGDKLRRKIGDLTVRSGNFGVIAGTNTSESMIIDYNL